MQLLDVKLGLTAAFHPSADGQSEKTNSTIEVMIHCFISGDPNKYKWWIDYLPIIEHEYNNTPQSSAGLPPNDLRYVMKTRGISDLLGPVKRIRVSGGVGRSASKSSRRSS